MRTAWIIVALLISGSRLWAGAEVDVRLTRALAAAGDNDRVLVWVYFSDKGPSGLTKNFAPEQLVSSRSLTRRRNVLSPTEIVDVTDLPVSESYVRQVEALVAGVRHRSKWLNAVSVAATPAEIRAVGQLPFVRRLETVARFRKKDPPVETSPADLQPMEKTLSPTDLNYGPSLDQLAQINVPAVHNTGNYAQGVIVGVFDNGFRLPNHEALTSLDILATYDFVDGKTSVVPVDLRSNFGAHGILTLSTIAGYTSGELIGPAFEATYILARTENDSSETPLEEDNWVAAIEWADSIGVQVTSTSLGYLGYDSPYTGWTWEDMNGTTTAISRAATMAARKGIVVVNSAGNEGSNAEHNTLMAPADADSIIAVGAAYADGTRVYFSSVGPTTSIPARIKPDLAARGASTYCASPYSTTSFTTASGTSLSCPLVAGVAALLVAADPTATPMQIIAALKATASQATTPDNLLGWGVVNAQAAITHLISTDTGGSGNHPSAFVLKQNYPNPFNPRTRFWYELPIASRVTLRVFDVLGQEVRTVVDGDQPAGVYRTFSWDATDNTGLPVASGMYLARLEAEGIDGSSFVRVQKMMLVR